MFCTFYSHQERFPPPLAMTDACQIGIMLAESQERASARSPSATAWTGREGGFPVAQIPQQYGSADGVIA